MSNHKSAMPTVKFTQALKRFYPKLTSFESEHASLSELLDFLEANYPGLPAYIVDEQGQLRKHVNIFLDGSMVKDREGLTDDIADIQEIYIMQALSGG